MANKENQRQQQEETLVSLYEESYAQIARYIFVRIRNRHEAEDLASETFVRALQRLDRYEDRGLPMKAWVFKIAHNLVVDYIRKASKQPAVPLDDVVLSGGADPQEIVEHELQTEQLAHALEHLTPAQQEVIGLRFFAGLSSTEVAELMGKKLGAVREMQRAAVSTLRTLHTGKVIINDQFDRIFDNCIDRLKRRQPVDHILQLYPDHAEALAPLLKATSDLQEQASFIPSEEAKAAGRQRLLQARYEMSQQHSAVKVSLIDRLFGQPNVWASIAAVLLMFIIGLAVVTLIDGGNDEPEETVAIPGTSTTLATSTTPTAPTTTLSGTSTAPTTTPEISPTTTTPDTSVPPTTTPGDVVVADAGFLEIRVTDAPNYDVSAVYLTISNIEVHQPQTGEQEAADEGSWETVIGESHTFELLKLRGGIEEVLGSRQLPVGHYSQIRLDVEEVIVTVDGENRIAKVPSEEVKLVGNFEIEAGQTTALTLDFDAAESVRVLGNGNVNFTPVVHVTVTKGQQQSAPTG